jgi:hypothetical protein
LAKTLLTCINKLNFGGLGFTMCKITEMYVFLMFCTLTFTHLSYTLTHTHDVSVFLICTYIYSINILKKLHNIGYNPSICNKNVVQTYENCLFHKVIFKHKSQDFCIHYQVSHIYIHKDIAWSLNFQFLITVSSRFDGTIYSNRSIFKCGLFNLVMIHLHL